MNESRTDISAITDVFKAIPLLVATQQTSIGPLLYSLGGVPSMHDHLNDTRMDTRRNRPTKRLTVSYRSRNMVLDY